MQDITALISTLEQNNQPSPNPGMILSPLAQKIGAWSLIIAAWTTPILAVAFNNKQAPNPAPAAPPPLPNPNFKEEFLQRQKEKQQQIAPLELQAPLPPEHNS